MKKIILYISSFFFILFTIKILSHDAYYIFPISQKDMIGTYTFEREKTSDYFHYKICLQNNDKLLFYRFNKDGSIKKYSTGTWDFRGLNIKTKIKHTGEYDVYIDGLFKNFFTGKIGIGIFIVGHFGIDDLEQLQKTSSKPCIFKTHNNGMTPIN